MRLSTLSVLTNVLTACNDSHMNTNEPQQSAASLAAYRDWEFATRQTSNGRSDEIHLEVQIKRLQRELREARKATKALQAIEDAAMRAYEATPYCVELVSA